MAAAAFFSGLFKAIDSEGTHKLLDTDLWHGHLVQTHGDKKLAIVFHAKEYPKNLRHHYPSAPQSNYESKDAKHGLRNLLWLESKNKIYMLDSAKGSTLYRKVIEDQAKEIAGWFGQQNPHSDTLKFKKIDQADVGKQLLDIYYLCHEVPPTPVRTIVFGPSGA